MSTDKLQNPIQRKRILIALSVFFIVILGAFILYDELVLAQRIETDNAYVGGNLVMLSSQVSGNVAEVRADETQLVTAGSPLIKLDPVDADLALTQAQARLGNVVRQQRERYASVAQYDASIALRQISLKNAEDNLARRVPLALDHTVSGEDIAHAKNDVADAQAALAVAARQADTIRAGVAGVSLAQHPSVLAAKADMIQAWLAVRRNAVLAPVTGYVAKRSVQVGSHVTPGTPLMSIVPLDQLWIDANFKESELVNIRVGQRATIEADLYGSKVIYHGVVRGLSAGTGSAFSLLPAQNATGNWIKVVQRVPVRITLDPQELAQHPLRVGLSSSVTIDLQQTSTAALRAAAPASIIYTTQALNQPVQQAEAVANAIIASNMAH